MSNYILDRDKVKKIVYGGDYNPEQWDEATWEKDYEMFHKAGVDILTLNVFNWAMLQPNEETYDFSRLDETVKRATENGMKICMATGTAAHPAWMAKKYPDILRTDIHGRKMKYGKRHNSCPSSPTFRKYSVELARQVAMRYKDNENIVAWHICNEYGGECYCENCEKAFRVWLRKKYGTLDAVNRAWNTPFWSHTYYDWDEIVIPSFLTEMETEDRGIVHGQILDYRRFNSDAIMQNYIDECNVVRECLPSARITTNFMGYYKALNYQKWAPYIDMISWDSYPDMNGSMADAAFAHELMRGLKKDQPFMLMEQSPSVVNWRPVNPLKRPGVMRLMSYQAVAHGADAVMFFQMRQSPGSFEKFHGALIDHSGRDDTRTFRECSELGAELKKIGEDVIGSINQPKAALIFDWEIWWAVEGCAGPSVDLKYTEEIMHYYRAFHALNIPVDIVSAETDFSQYKLVVAPLCYMIKGDFDERIKEFTRNGGTSVFTYFSGYADETDRIINGGFPGKLLDLTGIWAEELDALTKDQSNSFVYNGKTYPAKLLCDVLHPNDTEVLAVYDEDFYAGSPVITKNAFGNGTCYYMGTRSNDEFYKEFIKDVCAQAGVDMALYEDASQKEYPLYRTEITKRTRDNEDYFFLLNHETGTEDIVLPFAAKNLLNDAVYQAGDTLTMEARDVVILKKE